MEKCERLNNDSLRNVEDINEFMELGFKRYIYDLKV